MPFKTQFVIRAGFEPAAPCFSGRCSPEELTDQQKSAGCVFLLKTPRRAHDKRRSRANRCLNQSARQARAAFSLNGTRCRFHNSQRVFTPAGQILPDKGSEMLLWASFVYQDASYPIGSRPSGPRIRSFRIVSLIQGEFAVSVSRFRPASPQTRPCNRGVQIGVPAGLKARSLLS